MIANTIILGIHGFLIGIILRDCQKRFGWGVCLIMSALLVVLIIFSLFAYDYINLGAL